MSRRSTDRPEVPPSVTFDLEQPVAEPEMRPNGTVVLLISGAVDRQWAADAAIELGAAWAHAGRRIVLADLHLEDPLLHAGLDISNLEGMVDIFLYGASLSRIARPVRDGLFYLIPAGTYTPDVGEIYRHPRWKKLVSGFRDTDAALILFVPADSADLDALSNWSSEAILLGPPPEIGYVETIRRSGLDVLAIVEPPPTSPADTGAFLASPEASVITNIGLETPSRPSPGMDDNGADASGQTADPAIDVVPTNGEPGAERPASRPSVSATLPESRDTLELPPPPARRRRARRSASAFIWLILGIVVIGTAGYLIASLRPDLLPGSPAESPAGDEPAASGEEMSGAPSRLGELLPYSIQVRAFTSLAAAQAELASEERRVPSAFFFISPEEIQGVLYYKLLAGLAVDTIAAVALRDDLVVEGTIEREDAERSWSLLQFTPLAFDLGEFGAREDALATADSLLDQQIPTYLSTTPYSDGSQRWQLYGGAYRDSASAASMRELIESNGIDARLTARTGLPRSTPE